MKRLILILVIALLGVGYRAVAQNSYTISGIITGENHQPLSGAVVFIDGSQIITTTDNIGKFDINVSGPGAYRLSVKMLGYAAASNDVLLMEHAAISNFALAVKPVVLDEVKIGIDKTWANNFELFKSEFLGTTPNARECNIVNPEVVSFRFKNNLLSADANDFLIIENYKLGYRIKYSLKFFRHTKTFSPKHIHTETSYDGDMVFKEMQGTPEQKREWMKNRLHAYQGSIMHFFRSIFKNQVMQQGFIVSQITQNGTEQLFDEIRPIVLDTLVANRTAYFMKLKTKALHVVYSPSGSGKTVYASNLLPDFKEVTIDANGRMASGYVTYFTINGDWSHQRLADQLPFEYEPPVAASK